MFNLPLQQCLAWNAARPGRQVPVRIVRTQHRLLSRALRHLSLEGFDGLSVLSGISEVDSASIRVQG